MMSEIIQCHFIFMRARQHNSEPVCDNLRRKTSGQSQRLGRRKSAQINHINERIDVNNHNPSTSAELCVGKSRLSEIISIFMHYSTLPFLDASSVTISIAIICRGL